MSDSNTVWVVTREDGMDLDSHVAVFDSALKANKAFREIAQKILEKYDDSDPLCDENGNTVDQCVEEGYCCICGNIVRLDVYELNDSSDRTF